MERRIPVKITKKGDLQERQRYRGNGQTEDTGDARLRDHQPCFHRKVMHRPNSKTPNNSLIPLYKRCRLSDGIQQSRIRCGSLYSTMRCQRNIFL